MNVIEMHCLGDWDSFTREWCQGYGSDVVKDPERLSAHLKREGLMLRRLKEQVKKDMPAKNRIVQPIDLDDSLFGRLIQRATNLAKDAEKESDVLARGRMEREAQEETRRATGVAKVEAVGAFVAGLIESGHPTLVFAHHHDVHEALAERLKAYNPQFITGHQTASQKWEAQRAFQDGEADVCIIGLRSCTGIDGLQERAQCVAFAELDWSPGIHSQAEDRAHRDGLRQTLLSYYLVTDSGTDPDMLDNLGLKVAQFKGVMDDPVETEDQRNAAEADARTHMKRVIAKLRSGDITRKREVRAA